MTTVLPRFAAAALVSAMFCAPGPLHAQPGAPWAAAYYAGWSQGWSNNGHLRAEEIDFSAMTHVIHFSLVPNADGSINADANSITSTNSAALVSAAHAAGRKVLISVGGWASADGFRGATGAARRAVFVAALVEFMVARGYDGIDIDWEILESSDGPQYTAFITALRAALDLVSPRPLLTAATSWQAGVFSSVHHLFDQINIMTYDLSGAWPGWVTWHNAPVYDGGFRFPSTSGPVPSIDREVDRFLAAGIPASKLGIGIDFYGYVWSGGAGTPAGGATAPRQGWSTPPSVSGNVPYHEIMTRYHQPSRYRWDASAEAAYLSIDESGSNNDKFISYDDETSVRRKFDYVRSKGIGGLIIWELGGGYRRDQPSGQRDLLLQSVKSSLGGGGGGTPPPDNTAPLVAITAPGNGASVSGSVTVSVNASDDRSLASVTIDVDGNAMAAPMTSPPFAAAWNTGLVADGPHVVRATARDAAGNTAFAQVTVTVGNGVPPPPPPPPSEGGLPVALDGLAALWINASWNAQIDFASTARVHSGATSVRVSQGSWGGLSLHRGPWSSPAPVDPSVHRRLEFVVHPEAEAVSLGILLENEAGAQFPVVRRDGLPAGRWTAVSVGMDELNPGNHPIERISIMEQSGAARIFHLDEVRFAGGTPSVQPVAPILSLPSRGARNVPQFPVVRWHPVAGAASYRVQLSYSSGFTTSIVDASNVQGSSYAVTTSLGRSRRVYWRVAAVDASGNAGPWSEAWNFKTSSLNGVRQTSGLAGSEEQGAQGAAGQPDRFDLLRNYPNPFNPSTTIPFAIAEETEATLIVFDALGREVATLASGTFRPGRYEAVWDASGVAGGTYFVRLSSGTFTATRRLLLLK